MRLDTLNPGRYQPEELVVSGLMSWAKVDGQWYSMTNRGCDPVHMRNRDERAAFAHAIGVPVKDVENHVRREKRQAQREALAEELREARLLLQEHGYNVIDTKDR